MPGTTCSYRARRPASRNCGPCRTTRARPGTSSPGRHWPRSSPGANRCDPRPCPQPSPRWTTSPRRPSRDARRSSSRNKAGTLFYINHKLFDHNRIDFRSKLNTVEEWTIKNDSDEVHSFHIHTNDFQVMSINGKTQANYGLRDTVDVPPRGNMVIRIRFLDYPGKTVLHCHILNHEDAGMMAVLQIDK
ncbi:multicopper oxidase domain-containing protein [Streptomyces sp. NPDC088253]|uniref:multicopper oxidase domain-containing protein n=1 Tax=Streptomyces sp. NPDC088253 TaxID=3365846 RepID=UPI00382C653D